jgi:hypothetical protein
LAHETFFILVFDTEWVVRDVDIFVAAVQFAGRVIKRELLGVPYTDTPLSATLDCETWVFRKYDTCSI